eukprot:264024-Chlamydomonas_euryale.AAC.1
MRRPVRQTCALDRQQLLDTGACRRADQHHVLSRIARGVHPGGPARHIQDGAGAAEAAGAAPQHRHVIVRGVQADAQQARTDSGSLSLVGYPPAAPSCVATRPPPLGSPPRLLPVHLPPDSSLLGTPGCSLL